jgi:hypothetical protein
MEKNQKIAVAVIVAIALIAAWQLGKKPVTDQNENQNQNQEMLEENRESEKTPTPTPKQSESTQGEYWEGVLLESDNTNKGNYRLQTNDHMLYLRTSRDFSSMLGKNVRVTYEGTLENFVLGDIDVVQK